MNMVSDSSQKKKKERKAIKFRVKLNELFIILIPGIYTKFWSGFILRIKILFINPI